MEPDRSLLASVRDDRFKQFRIYVRMQLYDPEIIQIRLRGNLLNVARLGILDIDYILSCVLQPADQDKVRKGPGLPWRRRLCAFGGRLRWRRGTSVLGSACGSVFLFGSGKTIFGCPVESVEL